MLSRNILYFGQEEGLPQRLNLRAGPLSLVYEEGDLRYIKLGEHEILRRVYVAIRDQNWGTTPAVLSKVQVEKSDDSFNISYEVANKQAEVDFFWRGTISGDAQGTIKFTMDGEARATFQRSRIGFCVLHPTACLGLTCQIEHVDGAVEEGVFPRYIAPQLLADGQIKPVYPFAEMRALSYEVRPGVRAEIRFEGDIFEMEDQRNWTDASYKTYCTPLRLPFPVEIKQGTKVAQSITLTVQGVTRPPESEGEKVGQTPLSLTLQSASTRQAFPRLGLGVANHGQPLTPTELARLQALHLSHLRVDLALAQPNYEAALRQAWSEAQALGTGLEAALLLSDSASAELTALRAVVDQVQPAIQTWLVFHEQEEVTAEKWVQLAREHLAGYDPQAKIGGGSNAYFTQINRNPLPLAALDLVSYSLNPEVHAFDNASLAETLEVQGTTVDSARYLIGATPLAVSPVTLRPRLKPNGSGPAPKASPGELPPQVDVRQMSLFGAGWTVGSLKYLAESGVDSLTYYETSGWRGVMDTETGSPLPEKFPSLPGAVFPIYHILADAGEFAGGEVIPTQSSDILQLQGLALHKDGKTRVLLANLSAEPQRVVLPNLSGPVQVRYLDETNAVEAMRSPEKFRQEEGESRLIGGPLELTLQPYAIARIDTNSANGQ